MEKLIENIYDEKEIKIPYALCTLLPSIRCIYFLVLHSFEILCEAQRHDKIKAPGCV